MTRRVAKISSHVTRGQGRTRMPSAVRSKATCPRKPRASAHSAGSWMRLPGSIRVRWVVLMKLSSLTGARWEPSQRRAVAAREASRRNELPRHAATQETLDRFGLALGDGVQDGDRAGAQQLDAKECPVGVVIGVGDS